MTLKQYLILMTFGTVICWASWGVTIWSIDPDHAGFLGFVFFYASLFLALLGTFSVLGFMIKKKTLGDDELIFRHVKRTFRQGAMLAFFCLMLLAFRQMQILTWWNAVLIAILFAVLEGIVFTNYKHSNRDYV